MSRSVHDGLCGTGVIGSADTIWSMKVLMTVQPAFGHLHPVVPLAGALAEAGHDVVLASSASFSSQLAATGLRWVPAGIDWLESAPAAAFPDITQYRGLAGKQFILGEIFSGRTAAPMAWDLLAFAEGWRPDLVNRGSSAGRCWQPSLGCPAWSTG